MALTGMLDPMESEALKGRFSEDDHYFHQHYLTEQQADDDAAELLGLLDLPPGARVLDVGCGEGRLSVRLAALGFVVVGIDADPDQLERARARRLPPGSSVEWRFGDAAELVEKGTFDAVFCWFNTLGFGSEEHHQRVLDALCSALRPGGVLVIDTLDPEGFSELPGEVTEPARISVGEDSQVDRARFDHASGRLVVDRVTVRDGQHAERHLSVQLFSPARWAAELERRDLQLETATGRAGIPVDQGEGELVLMGRKRRALI